MVLDEKDRKIMDETSLKPSMNKDGSRATKRGIVANVQKLWISRVVPYEIFHPGTSLGKTSGKSRHKFLFLIFRFFDFLFLFIFIFLNGWSKDFKTIFSDENLKSLKSNLHNLLDVNLFLFLQLKSEKKF